jgi:hypothetical protein
MLRPRGCDSKGRRHVIAIQAISLATLLYAPIGCAVNRREVRQEERVEQRTQDRYERRHGGDD